MMHDEVSNVIAPAILVVGTRRVLINIHVHFSSEKNAFILIKHHGVLLDILHHL